MAHNLAASSPDIVLIRVHTEVSSRFVFVDQKVGYISLLLFENPFDCRWPLSLSLRWKFLEGSFFIFLRFYVVLSLG